MASKRPTLAPNGPKWPQNGPNCPTLAQIGLKMASKRPKNGLKTTQTVPHWPKTAQTGPHWPQNGPKRPKNGPKWPQNGLKMAQRASKWPTLAQNGPKWKIFVFFGVFGVFRPPNSAKLFWGQPHYSALRRKKSPQFFFFRPKMGPNLRQTTFYRIRN